MSTYKQYRLAKRNGEIVQQERLVTADTKRVYPVWQFWHWGLYEVTYNYGEWKDIPFADADEVEN
jgi:hypothetical protein